MHRIVSMLPVLAATLAVSACVSPLARQEAPLVTASIAVAAAPTPSESAASWQMPWQISPVTIQSEAREETALAWVPQTGYVRGSRVALASLGRPLVAAEGPNRTVEACRNVVQSEAAKIGAREVEAVSAGPHRRIAGGRYQGPVEMRITYARPGGYEVRMARMTCVVDSGGKIVDAFINEG
ncbi:hypothetical protein [Salinarimonas soli]|uniref:Lipoprotein n=1 Tax=Salinarimonas soli TaxID=1638099 RepID=A0A5B2V925_9HYPH|nr:hypothetical protein [Salinarimonas soli]KAA2234839.1 hypothetical protein F0L46_22705 [Salinarimonas soli]